MKKFSHWIYWFKRLGIAHGFFKEDVILFEDGFKEYFNDGLTPRQAFKEEFGNITLQNNPH